jgi:lysyl-tRNA synthetase class 2
LVEPDDLWQPSAALATLKARAQLYADVRTFFAARGVLEVETPVLSAAATVDRHIESFSTRDGQWLQTSPEFAMKRLLAAGSGPIYQIARAFRREESGRHHNPEFSLLEWYRPGWDHFRLMDEVEALILALLDLASGPFERLSYEAAFVRHAGFDPHALDAQQLADRAYQEGLGIPPADRGEAPPDCDFWLDLWMSQRVGPALGATHPVFVHDFPASQAALARIRPGSPPLAERFELFWKGIELANGFHELCDAAEQRRRFEADRSWRMTHGRTVPPLDERLIAAMHAGLPPCAGVALGLDRLLMLKLDLSRLADALAFDSARA